MPPIWLKISETARRALQRIGAVLDFARIKGWRPAETSLKSVRKGLPRQPQADSYFEAMPYEDVPGYMAKLIAADQTVGRQALQLTILAAVRSNETRFAVRQEFDHEADMDDPRRSDEAEQGHFRQIRAEHGWLSTAIMESHRRAIETSDLMARLEALEREATR